MSYYDVGSCSSLKLSFLLMSWNCQVLFLVAFSMDLNWLFSLSYTGCLTKTKLPNLTYSLDGVLSVMISFLKVFMESGYYSLSWNLNFVCRFHFFAHTTRISSNWCQVQISILSFSFSFFSPRLFFHISAVFFNLLQMFHLVILQFQPFIYFYFFLFCYFIRNNSQIWNVSPEILGLNLKKRKENVSIYDDWAKSKACSLIPNGLIKEAPKAYQEEHKSYI